MDETYTKWGRCYSIQVEGMNTINMILTVNLNLANYSNTMVLGYIYQVCYKNTPFNTSINFHFWKTFSLGKGR